MARWTTTLLNAVSATGAGTARQLGDASDWTATLRITGTADVDIEVSNDGSNFRRLGERFGADDALMVERAGFRNIRANVIRYTSGTVTVTASAVADTMPEGWNRV